MTIRVIDYIASKSTNMANYNELKNQNLIDVSQHTTQLAPRQLY